MADRNTLLPEFALVAKRQRLELSTPAVLPLYLRADMRGSQFDRFCYQRRARTNHQVVARLYKRWEQYQR
jgi:hypothetical protein